MVVVEKMVGLGGEWWECRGWRMWWMWRDRRNRRRWRSCSHNNNQSIAADFHFGRHSWRFQMVVGVRLDLQVREVLVGMVEVVDLVAVLQEPIMMVRTLILVEAVE